MWGAWLPLVLAVWGAPADAADSVTTATNYFPVTGSTMRELRRSINQARPGGAKAGTDALTTWQLKWNSRVASANGQCRLVGFEIKTTVVITMPSWRAPTNAPPELVQRWVSYYTALQHHEQYHAQSATLATEAVRKKIGTIGPEANCAVLQTNIKTMVDAVIAQFRQRDADYDRETDHGRKEGARLP